MTRRIPAFLCLLTLITATRAEAPATQPAPPLPPMTELPDGWVIYDQALTLQALIDKTKPILHFDDGDHGTLLVWAGTTSSGNRFFRLAAARLFTPKNAKPTWIIASVGHGNGPFYGDPLPPTTIFVGKGAPPLFNGIDKPIELSMGTANGAKEVLSSPANGTLYEIEYYYNLAAEAGQGLRLMLLHDPAGTWRLAAKLDCDYWDDTGYMESSDVHHQWTGNAQAPIRLTEISRVSTGDPMGTEPDLNWEFDSTYEGPLPIQEPSTFHSYVVVGKGNTLSWICKTIVENDEIDNTEIVKAKMASLLQSQIQQLNPHLDPSRMHIGQRIEVPSFQTRLALIKQARTPTITKPPEK